MGPALGPKFPISLVDPWAIRAEGRCSSLMLPLDSPVVVKRVVKRVAMLVLSLHSL
jgi:hypothetical protein